MATIIDKALLKILRPEIDAAVAAVASRYGLASLHCGNGSFDPVAGTFTFKLEGAAEGAIGKAAALYMSPDARFLGLPPLGSKFTWAGHSYVTAGLKPSGSKVICTRDDGNEYLFPVDFVVRACKSAVPA